MQLDWIARKAVMAQRMRARIKRAGVVGRGLRLWTPLEDEAVRRLYPNYKALQKKLRNRTYYAIRARARTIGVAKRRHIWTAAEVSRLRRLYPTATKSDLLDAFNGLRWMQIWGKTKHIKIHRARKPLAATGFAIIDKIRARAFELNLSMVDLDEMARTKRYFQNAGWHVRGVSRQAVYRAIEALDGQVVPVWR